LTVSHARMEAQQVTLQPLNDEHCAIYALLNLYRQLGVKLPSLEKLSALKEKQRQQGGVTVPDLMCFMIAEDFPGSVSLSVAPSSLTFADILPDIIARGCGVIVAFEIVMWGRQFLHAAVVESCDLETMTVLCSVNGKIQLPYVMKVVNADGTDHGAVLPVAYIHGELYPFGFFRMCLVAEPKKKPLEQNRIYLVGGY
jgi:hypothetical protein